MNSLELAFLVSQNVAAAELPDSAIEDAISTYNLQYGSYVDPKIPARDCIVDSSDYPNIDLFWPKKGPAALNQEEALLISESIDGSGEKMYGNLKDFELDVESSDKFVDVVLAMDISGSMRNNSEVSEKIEKQILSKSPNARVRIWVVTYDTSIITVAVPGKEAVRLLERPDARAKHYPYSYSPWYYPRVTDTEEDHIGAIYKSLGILADEPKGPDTKRYIILITDEGEKRYSSAEREKAAGAAKHESVKIHLIYSNDEAGQPYSSRMAPENFSSLIAMTRSTGGSSRLMEHGKIPEIFQTVSTVSDYLSVNFEDTDPYLSGNRTWTVINGEGAECEINVDQEQIEDAIAKGRLAAPEDEGEMKMKDAKGFSLSEIYLKNSGNIKNIGLLALGAVIGWIARGKKRKSD